MKKYYLVILAVIFLFLFSTNTVFGNSYTLQSENGLLLPPTGLGFDCNAFFPDSSQSKEQSLPAFLMQVSYGAFPMVTIAGEFSNGYSDSNLQQKLVKLYFSPFQGKTGYTIYLGYDLINKEMPVYGISLWSKTNFLVSFVNFETKLGEYFRDTSPFVISPGASLRLGPKIGLAGELSIDPANLSIQRSSVGISYFLTKNIQTKFAVTSNSGTWSDRVYRTGVSLQI